MLVKTIALPKHGSAQKIQITLKDMGAGPCRGSVGTAVGAVSSLGSVGAAVGAVSDPGSVGSAVGAASSRGSVGAVKGDVAMNGIKRLDASQIMSKVSEADRSTPHGKGFTKESSSMTMSTAGGSLTRARSWQHESSRWSSSTKWACSWR